MSPPRRTVPAFAGLPHGFFGREGGISDGLYASLNVGLGSSDDRAAVAENKARIAHALGATIVTVHQVHSPTVVRVLAPIPDDDRPHADAMVTDVPGLALGVLTADCAPVLFADAEAGVIGAAHAGWKGALYGVIAATVAMMEGLGARRERIAAAVGPCIARRSYEVDDAFLARFTAEDADHEHFFAPGKPGHRQFDLEGFVVARLAAEGLTRIAALGEDTYAQAPRYFSYRRATHAGEPDYGRQLSAIALPARTSATLGAAL